MAPKKCANCAMGHNGEIAAFVGIGDAAKRIGDPCLRVHGTLPALKALVRVGEERVGRAFKIFGRKEARRAPVVLAKSGFNPNLQPAAF